MTEIFLLGTFHFLESTLDFYSEDIQNQLELLTQKILPFRPDMIAVEAPIREQVNIDKTYAKFSLSDLKDYNKMKTSALGQINMFGTAYPVTYNNEAIQIAYRMGKQLGFSNVFGIDDDTILDMSVMENPNQLLSEAMNKLQSEMELHKDESIIELYRYYNSEKWSKLNHNVYIQANLINTDGCYNGSLMVAKWYERNLKIFSNIQKLATKSKKLFILNGAGHLHILKEFINADDNLILIDPYNYL